MHGSVEDFISETHQRYPNLFKGKVLEAGSYDINGSPRKYFQAKEYVGVDWRPGPGVDVVTMFDQYNHRPDGYFDFVISTSMLEHDPYWQISLRKMVDLLADGGSLLVTCAGAGFHEHELETAPPFNEPLSGNWHQAGKHYGNLMAEDVVPELLSFRRFRSILVHDDPDHHDLRILAHEKLPKRAGLKN